MSERSRKLFFRRAAMSLWAVLTVVLLFMVILLVGEMAKLGHDPFEIPERAVRQANQGTTVGDVHEFRLYFSSPDGRLLMDEIHRMPRSEFTVENCRALLSALIDGPRGNLLAVVPNETAIRGMYMVDGGELIVDLSREVGQAIGNSASAEALMTYGIVNTLTQPGVRGRDSGQDEVRRVRFLFEGSPPSDGFPRHVDLTDPIVRNEEWLAQQGGAPAGDA
jgi:hypothetical protein